MADITASVAETSNCFAATDLTQRLTVNKVMGNISWSLHNTTITATISDAPFILSSAVSTLPNASISYRSDNENVAIVNATSGEVTCTGSGSCIITAIAEAEHYLPAQATVTLLVSLATQMDDIDQNAMRLYPNPASTTVNISGGLVEKVTIYDLSGQKVMERFNTKKIDVSSLKRGVYIVRAGDAYIEKLILN